MMAMPLNKNGYSRNLLSYLGIILFVLIAFYIRFEKIRTAMVWSITIAVLLHLQY
mgnify:FL=1